MPQPPHNTPESATTVPPADPNGETVLIDSPGEPPTSPAPLWHWIIDRNPLFLLSGVSMFAGCFAISRFIHADAENPKALLLLLGLLGLLNLYELMVIALGLLLARSAALVRDARHLLGLALLLMIDLGFVYHESATASLTAGVAIGVVASLLGLIKTLALTRGVGVRLSPAATTLVGLDLAAVFLMPVVMRWIAGDGFVSPSAMLGVFAGVGALVALHALPGTWSHCSAAPHRDFRQLQSLVHTGVVFLPVLSAIAHAGVGPWVYGTGYLSAYVSPVLLGLAVVTGRQLVQLGSRRVATGTALVLVSAGLAAALPAPPSLVGLIDVPINLYVSPLRLALVASAGIVLWLALRDRVWWMHLVALGLLGCALLGHTPLAMLHRAARGLRSGWDLLRDVTPDSQLEWGVLGVGSAFVLLAMGAAVSLWRYRRTARAISDLSDGGAA
ncbi:MAG: hypothetical protein ACIAXF_12775 [Phycisphaerales bacterium JB063]